MSYAKLASATIVTAADGSGSAQISVNGFIESIRYVKTNFADTVDFTITNAETGETIWAELNVTASKTCRPRGATNDTAGVAALYAAGGTAVNEKIAIAGTINIAVANGGNTTSGTFHVVTA